MATFQTKINVFQHLRDLFNGLTNSEKIYSVAGSVYGWFAGIVLMGSVPIEFVLKGIGAIAIAFCSSVASVYGKKAAGWIELKVRGKKKKAR